MNWLKRRAGWQKLLIGFGAFLVVIIFLSLLFPDLNWYNIGRGSGKFAFPALLIIGLHYLRGRRHRA